MKSVQYLWLGLKCRSFFFPYGSNVKFLVCGTGSFGVVGGNIGKQVGLANIFAKVSYAIRMMSKCINLKVGEKGR